MPENAVGSFVDPVLFPSSIGEGVVGGPMYKTSIVETFTGAEQRNQCWLDPVCKWNIPFGNKSKQDLSSLLSFFRARGGKNRGFLFADLVDDHASQEYQGTGNGVQTQFQLVHHYVTNRIETRIITRPLVASTVVWVNGVSQPTGWSVSGTTGVLTFTAPPANGAVITASFYFNVPVRFDTDEPTISLENLLSTWDSIPLVEVREPSTAPVCISPSAVATLFPDVFGHQVGGPRYSTQMSSGGSGFEERSAEWGSGRLYWNLTSQSMRFEDARTLNIWFRSHKGKARTFPYQDWSDYQVVSPEAMTGSGLVYQLVKRYYDGSQVVVRNISQPIPGTVKIWDGSTVLTSGYFVDYTSGIVMFDSTPAFIPAATFQFYTPVRFDTDWLNLKQDMGQQWSVSDLPLVEVNPVPAYVEGGVQ